MGSGKVVVENFNVLPVCRRLALWDLQIRAEDAALACLFGPFLGPVDFSAFNVERDANTPFLRVFAGTRIALAGVDKRFDFGAIQIRTYDPHALAIRPVKLPVFFIKLQLLRSERARR